jgi:hypothetical protein
MSQVTNPTSHARSERPFACDPWSITYTVLLAVLAVVTGFLMRTGAEARADVRDRTDGAYAITSLSLSASMSAEHRDGLLPPVSSTEPILMPDADIGHQGFLVDGRVTAVKVDKDAAILLSYLDGYRAFTMHNVLDTPENYYLGHAVTNEAEGRTLIRTYRERLERGESLDGDIPVEDGTGTGGSDTLFQLRTDLADVLAEKGITVSDDFMEQVPVFIGQPGQYDMPGGWLVPLNRQAIRFVPFPGPFPMTEEFIGALESLRNDFSNPLEDE